MKESRKTLVNDAHVLKRSSLTVNLTAEINMYASKTCFYCHMQNTAITQ